MRMFSGSDGYCSCDSPTKVYVLEKLWVSPLENRDAHGYSPCGAFTKKYYADKWIEENQEQWGQDKCWSLMFGELPLYRLTELDIL